MNTGAVAAGGDFTAVGNGSKVMGYFGVYDHLSVLHTAAPGRTDAAAAYPNPAHARVTLRLPPQAQAQTVQLLDGMGRPGRRYAVPAQDEATSLNLRGLPLGVCTVRCGAASVRLVVE